MNVDILEESHEDHFFSYVYLAWIRHAHFTWAFEKPSSIKTILTLFNQEFKWIVKLGSQCPAKYFWGKHFSRNTFSGNVREKMKIWQKYQLTFCLYLHCTALVKMALRWLTWLIWNWFLLTNFAIIW